MSTDWFLFSPSRKRKAMVGSIGLGGVKVWPSEYGGDQFLRWAIDEHVTDIILVNEDDPRLHEDDCLDKDDFPATLTNGQCGDET